MKHLSDAPLYGKLLAVPTNIRPRLAILVRDKHSSLLQNSVSYGQKRFTTFNTGSPRHADFGSIERLSGLNLDDEHTTYLSAHLPIFLSARFALSPRLSFSLSVVCFFVSRLLSVCLFARL